MNAIEAHSDNNEVENPLTSVVDASPFPMATLNTEGTILHANRMTESLFCYEQQQLAIIPIETLFFLVPDVGPPQAHPSPFIQLWRGSLGTKRELTGLRQDGTQFPIEVGLHPRKTATGLFLLATFIDMTEQKWAKAEFDRLSRHHQNILNSAGEGIYGLNLNGQLTFINPTAVEMVGWEQEDLLGKSQHAAFNHSTPDGSQHSSDMCQIYAAFKDGNIHHIDDEVFWRRDGTCFPVEYTSTPLHDEEGNIIGAVVTFRDITQRKQVEEADKTLRVMKDEFIATASHELKTPIASLQGFMKLLLSGKVKDPAVQTEFLTRANQDVDRLLSLIHDLLDTSKLEAGLSHLSLEDLSLNSLIQETCDSFHQLARDKDVCLQHDLTPEAGMVKADRRSLQRVFVNLLSNAIKFSEPQRSIRVTSETSAQAVEVKVIDQGPGLPQDEANRLFEKFYQAKSTTKRADGGTGLGLFISKQIIEGHGGHISVESEVGKGTTFTVILPMTISDHTPTISLLPAGATHEEAQ